MTDGDGVNISAKCRKLLSEQAKGHRAVLSALRDGRKWERRFNVALLTALVGVIGVKVTGFGFSQTALESLLDGLGGVWTP